MNEFSAQIFDQLDAYTPEPDRWPDWRDVVRRARKQRTRRLVVALAAVVIVLGSATAVTAALGGFDSWLSGTPGKPAPRAEQERFDAANRSLNLPLWAETHTSGSTTTRTRVSTFRASPLSVKGGRASQFPCRDPGATLQQMPRRSARREGRHAFRSKFRIPLSGGSFATSGAAFPWAT
jgi:hypothetical protein